MKEEHKAQNTQNTNDQQAQDQVQPEPSGVENTDRVAEASEQGEQSPFSSSSGNQQGAGGQNASGTHRSYVLGLVVLIVILALAAAFFMWRSGDSSDALGLNGSENQQQQTSGIGGDYPDVVARVNGAEITGDDLQASVEQTAQVATQQGLDSNDSEVTEQIESQALEVAINSALLVQAAEEAGITASQEDVASEIAALESQFGGAEQLQNEIDNIGLSEEQLRSDIREQLVVDEFIQASDEVSDISVSDEEVQQAYDQLSSQQEELPPFEEISSQVEQQLMAQKRQQATNALIERLRSEAEIEILI